MLFFTYKLKAERYYKMKLTVKQLERALEIQKQIERLEKELAAILSGVSAAPGPKAVKVEKPKKRVLSPEARERIAAAQRERWKRQKAMQQAKASQK